MEAEEEINRYYCLKYTVCITFNADEMALMKYLYWFCSWKVTSIPKHDDGFPALKTQFMFPLPYQHVNILKQII